MQLKIGWCLTTHGFVDEGKDFKFYHGFNRKPAQKSQSGEIWSLILAMVSHVLLDSLDHLITNLSGMTTLLVSTQYKGDSGSHLHLILVCCVFHLPQDRLKSITN